MTARLLLREWRIVAEDRFAEVVIWHVPGPVRGSDHNYKYSLAIVVNGVFVSRFDNEAGKGDHKHLGEIEVAYDFTTLPQLVMHFWDPVEAWRPG